MDSLPTLHLQHAKLRWNADAMPESEDYGDVYFSRADALGESTHVFLQGNGLPARFDLLPPASIFVIGELGFGSGLNFLNTCQLFDATAKPGNCLHYIACELHPMRPGDLRALHRQFPALQRYSELLLSQYPAHTAGTHQLRLGINDKVVMLTLLYGDASFMLSALASRQHFRVDAWYFDGFSPKVNPGLWAPALLGTVARLSKSGSTFSTYSVASAVRSGLSDAGFMVEKAPGFGLKRHMLTGRMPDQAPAPKRPQSGRHARPRCAAARGSAGRVVGLGRSEV